MKSSLLTLFLAISMNYLYAQETLQTVSDRGYTILTNRTGNATGYQGAIRTVATGTDCWGMLNMPDDVNATGLSSFWLIGRGNAYSDRCMTFHIPKYEDYSSVGNVPFFKFATSGDTHLFTLNSIGKAALPGQLIIGKENSVETDFHNAIVSRDVSYPNDVTNSQLALTGKDDGRKQMALGYDTNGNGFGFIAAGFRGVTWTNLALQPTGGNVGIGTTSPKEKLSVNGKIRAHEIKVEATNWPDYVFKEDHQLRSLQDIENYIQTNRHLPEIPSAAEAEKEGINLGDMNSKLLKKIEELTLHLIEMNKKLELQQLEIEKLKKD